MEVQRESLPGPSTLASASAGSTQDACEYMLNRLTQMNTILRAKGVVVQSPLLPLRRF